LASALLLLLALLVGRGELDSVLLACRLLGGGGALLLGLALLAALPGGRPRRLAIASLVVCLPLVAVALHRLLEASPAWAVAGALPVALVLSTRVWLGVNARAGGPPLELLSHSERARWLSDRSRSALALLAAGAAAVAALRGIAAIGEEDNGLLLLLLFLAAGLSTVISVAALALAAALAALHREYHLIVKPDEVARSNAARAYREKHPAANYAARDRVVYPTTEGHKKAILAGRELLTE
jgi:hypothetical protein